MSQEKHLTLFILCFYVLRKTASKLNSENTALSHQLFYFSYSLIPNVTLLFIYTCSVLSSDGSGSAISGLGLGLENFTLKCQNFHFFPLRIKKNLLGSGQKVAGSKADWPPIYCRSKVSSAWVRAYLFLTRLPLLLDFCLQEGWSL